MESTANLMIFCGIRRKFYKFHGKQQNAMANLETGTDPMHTHRHHVALTLPQVLHNILIALLPYIYLIATTLLPPIQT